MWGKVTKVGWWRKLRERKGIKQIPGASFVATHTMWGRLFWAKGGVTTRPEAFGTRK